jgi:hypothetical protein
LENHNESQKNHKMENQNCIGLQISSSTHWTYNIECFSTYFCCNFRSLLFSITVKNVLNILSAILPRYPCKEGWRRTPTRIPL